jgi:hypothetical protein
MHAGSSFFIAPGLFGGWIDQIYEINFRRRQWRTQTQTAPQNIYGVSSRGQKY